MTTFGGKQVGDSLYVKDCQMGLVYPVKISHISVYGDDIDISYTAYRYHHNFTVRVNKYETEHLFKTRRNGHSVYKKYIISCAYVVSKG